MTAATITPWATPAERHAHDDDGGFSARLANGLEHAAAEIRNLPGGLMPAVTNMYFYASVGTDDDRHAAVDAWAAQHHVRAGWDPALGWYCAVVITDEMTRRCVALPVREAAEAEPGIRKQAAA